MKIDIFTHILPKRYLEMLDRMTHGTYYNSTLNQAIASTYDLDVRFSILDKFKDMMQVLTLGAPPIEAVAKGKQAIELARAANDGMAELVEKYPDRFVSAVASLPMVDIDASLIEVDRAINDLKLRGIQVYTPMNGKPIDGPEFLPLYEKMAAYDLPIWIHPMREMTAPDYAGEKSSKYQIWGTFGWPFETSAAMTRLIFSGILKKFPSLKFITHHCGAMIPFFEQRIAVGYDLIGMLAPTKQRLTKGVLDYYRMFYADTAIHSKAAIRCGYEFFGPEHVLFATDMPYDNEFGARYIRQAMEAVQHLDIPDAAKRLIFEGNAKRIMRLPT